MSKVINMSDIKFDKAEHKAQKARWEIKCPKYKAELAKLQEHYGIRCTLDSIAQAEWDRDGAYARFTADNPMWLRVEAARDIVGAGFAKLVHEQLALGKSAEEIIRFLGTFDEWIDAWVNVHTAGIPLYCSRIKRGLLGSRRWHHEYN